MSDIVIRVENLYKEYRLGTISHGTLYKDLQSWWARICGKEDPNSIISTSQPFHLHHPASIDSENPHFLALQDVSFEVKRGEVLGIIGRNGAGKSTLLKILSEVTTPTKGTVKIKGKVASLLEVGTGFHPELTGRENIYLNGAILGMRKEEIRKKFDEIVAFAEIDQFIDTPVKRYSSGMYVRLAFAVAAHLEPEILIVDEVLAVGDAQFQKKCLGKMGDASKKEGKTILIVSHNMPVIINLCQRAILLNKGMAIKDDLPRDVVAQYLRGLNTRGGEMLWPDPLTAPGNDIARMHAVRILQEDVEGPTHDVDISKDVIIQICYWCIKDGARLYSALWLRDKMGVDVLSSSNGTSISLTEDPWYEKPHAIGLYTSFCRIPGNFLNEGLYSITPIIGQVPSETIALEQDVISFNVNDTGAMRKEYLGSWLGVIRPRLEWRTEHTLDKVESDFASDKAIKLFRGGDDEFRQI